MTLAHLAQPPEPSMEENASSSSDKLLAVLETIAGSGACSLADVVERSGLPFSTVHRIAGQLMDRGYIVRLKRGQYRIGPAALALGRNSSIRTLLEEASRPLLGELARACRAHVHLGVFEDDMVTYLANVSYGRNDFRVDEGLQLEAYCTGIGKVLLANLSPGARDAYLSQDELVALTANTIIDRDVLSDELALIRDRGWGTDLGEVEPDQFCIAVPVYDRDRTVLAAISASVRNRQGNLETVLRLLPELRKTADALSARLFPA